MRLSRREKEDVAGPSVLTKGKTALEGIRWSSHRGRRKPGEPASVTAPASLRLFHPFCFLHPFFLFWFLFPVISFSCTRSAYNHCRVNFLRNYVVNLFLYPEYKAWDVLRKHWVNWTHRHWLPSLMVKKSGEAALPCLRFWDSGTSNFMQLGV